MKVLLGVGCRVSGVGCRVSGVGCRVSGVGCRVSGKIDASTPRGRQHRAESRC
ncbi:hypothetical protein [Coleofasciculus chthonoplastes]|uniref:hypothetical protein n=1 Tax=Coleofasciculus chthonoplastes TaxID=64178 RepID=UPI0032F7FFF5